MHFFLTGQHDIGKTTIINKVMDSLDNFKITGFCTYIKESIEAGKSYVYMTSPINKDIREAVAFRNTEALTFDAYPKVFDNLGVKLLEDVSESNLVIMDELGFMEKDASLFQKKVLKILDGDINVLGSIKTISTPFLDKVKNHDKVRIIEVKKENRDQLPSLILDLIMSEWNI